MNPRHCASIVADEGVVMTAQGTFTRRELAEAGAVVSGGSNR